MRYKVAVTKVEVVERWIRATDEEDAIRKTEEILSRPFSFIGEWETKAAEVRVLQAEEAASVQAGAQRESQSMLLTLKDAATELGISYGTLRALMGRGEIEFTRVGSSKRISRESLAAFIRVNTHR